MSEIIDYLQAVKKQKAIKSDREFALKCGLTQACMCNFMTGTGNPNDESCIKIAQFAGDDPAYVIALARKSKATDSSRPYWDKILKVLATCSIVALLCINIIPLSHATRYIMLNYIMIACWRLR